jgi:hypothetical protein
VTEPDRVITAAEKDLAGVRDLIGKHLKASPGHGVELTAACPDCRSLAAHLERCRDQVELLAGSDAETENLW